MKKDTLYWGLSFIALSIVFIVIYLVTGGEGVTSFFMSFACGLVGPGIVMVYKYFHWSRPENKAVYEERLKNEKINATDERKVMIRRKTGHVMYTVTVVVLAVLVFVLSLIGVDTWVLALMAILWVFEIFGGYILYRYYVKKM